MSVLPQWATPFLSSRCRVRSACGTWRHLRETATGSLRVQQNTWLAATASAAHSVQSQARAMSGDARDKAVTADHLIIWLEIKDFFFKKGLPHQASDETSTWRGNCQDNCLTLFVHLWPDCFRPEKFDLWFYKPCGNLLSLTISLS